MWLTPISFQGARLVKVISSKLVEILSHKVICAYKNWWKTYTLMAPVAVPIAAILKSGSQAKVVGLLGNPWRTVWKTEKKNDINLQ